MARNTITGKILQISPVQTITGKTGKQFQKQELVLDCTKYDPYTGERGFENTPAIEFTQDRCAMLNGFQPGQIVTVAFDLFGSRSTDGTRWFTSVRGYAVELRAPRQTPDTAQPSAAAPQPRQSAPQAPQTPSYAQPAQPQYSAQGYAPQYAPQSPNFNEGPF
ncbi:MAG: DUF3127 domain-containing protein [Bacteroidales bacterium]|nr:DUF3127 domain-containing protein [Bacteroidales bacterium]